MSRKFISFGMLFALVLLSRLLLPASALAQVTPSMTPTATPTPESTKVFSAGGKTIGGPGDFLGACDSKSEDIYEGGTKAVCVTIENTGSCDLILMLKGADGKPFVTSTIDEGTAKTVCSDKKVVVSISIVCMAPGKVCNYRWRIDDNS